MNIEKTISEHAVSDILTPMLDSQDRIVTEDVAPLFDAATGLDTPPASGTVTTTIEESRSVITAIIRKAWTATLTMLGGASVISYIAAAYTYLRNRLQGNETYGIPDRRSEISASSPLAANLALLNDRKISGVPEAADGMSMVHLLHDTSAITELTDDNKWVLTKNNYVSTLASLFPAATKMTLGITKSNGIVIASGSSVAGINELNLPILEEITTIASAPYSWHLFSNLGCTKLYIPSLTNFIGYGTNSGASEGYVYDMPNLTEIEFGTKGVPFTFDMRHGANNCFVNGNTLPSLKTIKIYCDKFYLNGLYYRPFIQNGGALETLIFDTLTSQQGDAIPGGTSYGGVPNLIHVEFGEGTSCSLELLRNWSPTNALDASRTDLIEEGSTAQNNLQQFLSNFRDYIALRLTDNGRGKTLTLSQAVFSAVIEGASPICDEIKGIIEDKNWKVQDTNNNIFPTT